MFPFPQERLVWSGRFPLYHSTKSTLMNLQDLPVFGTTGEGWVLYQVPHQSHPQWFPVVGPRIFIHMEDIHQLTGLSMEGDDVTKGFQGSRKHGKKKGEPTLYDKFNTRRGGRGVMLEPILPEPVHCACYLIAYKVMRTYT
jgi:hypothetical protein